MISAVELRAILDAFPYADNIPIEGGDYMARVDGMAYILHRQGREYRVKGLGWGHGHLFVGTEELGTTGIKYEHAPIYEPVEDPDDADACPAASPQTTLDVWTVGA